MFVPAELIRLFSYFMSGREEAPGERHLYRVRDTKEDVNNVECLTCDMGGSSNFTDPAENDCTVLNAHFSPTADFYVRECLGPGIPSLALVATKNNTVGTELSDVLRQLL